MILGTVLCVFQYLKEGSLSVHACKLGIHHSCYINSGIYRISSIRCRKKCVCMCPNLYAKWATIFWGNKNFAQLTLQWVIFHTFILDINKTRPMYIWWQHGWNVNKFYMSLVALMIPAQIKCSQLCQKCLLNILVPSHHACILVYEYQITWTNKLQIMY